MMHEYQRRPKAGFFERLTYKFLNRSKRLCDFADQPVDVQRLILDSAFFSVGKLLYVKNSKAGCTSIMHYLFYLENHRDHPGNIHNDTTHIKQGIGYVNDIINAINSKNDHLVFTAVRDPVERFNSVYHDFVVKKQNSAHKFYFDKFKLFGCLDSEKSEEYRLDAFVEFVSEELREYGSDCNRHWRLQKDNLAIDTVDYDFVGKIEEIESWFGSINKRYGVNTIKLSRYNTTQSSMTLTRSQVRRVAALYEEDYERFGYSF